MSRENATPTSRVWTLLAGHRTPRDEMKPARYQHHINLICTCSHLSPYKALFNSLPELDMDQRSAVAKLCRAQCYPPSSSRLAKMVSCLTPEFQRRILPLCQTPLLAGLVLQLILCAPMSEYSIQQVYTRSMQKEVSVMESVKRECTLNFEPFFGAYDEPVNNIIPPNPTVAQYVHHGIDRWIVSLQARLLFPRLGSKTVSKLTANEVFMVDPHYTLNDEKGVTPIDLERVYHRYQVEVQGPCEMRQKWYCSNLQPRTYYTQGGDAYHTSKYLAIPLVDLCDILPATNRRSRVNPGRIVIRSPTDDVAYYDLTSFTSNLHVHRDFMYRLARYCIGKKVRILDSVHGITEVDLGAMIETYTRVNLHDPSYTLPHKYDDPSVLHYHSVAGFLGVYGNIASATFVHGIVMAMHHDCFDENNVAGDDGLVVTDSVDDTLATVGLLGIVKDEKTFRDSEGCCIHLKRPITRIGSRLLHGDLITWPSLEPGEIDTDPRYPYLRGMSNRERKDAIAGSVTAFLRKLENRILEPHELDVVDLTLSHIYDTYRLPRAGYVPQVGTSDSGFIPIYERRFIGMDPITNTIVRHYANMARLPLRGKLDWEYEMLMRGTFQCNTTKLLNHLVALGYLERKKVSTLVFGQPGLDQLLREYTSPDPPIYEYEVLHNLPVWIVDFIGV